jgi:integrase/recombinase XerD
MEKSFEQFLVLKGLNPITVKGYIGCFKRMRKQIGENPSAEEVKQYVYILYTSKCSYSHKTNTALGLEKYMEFIGNPIFFGRQRKPKTIIKNTLTEAEVTRLLFSCKTIREKAMVAVLAYSGVRNAELCRLKVKDLLLSQNALRINQGKFAQDGLSEMPPECSEILTKYLIEHPREAEDFLFTTLVKKNQLATGDVRKWVKIIAKRALIEKRVYPHLLRHTLACQLVLRGADVVTIKKQLRHQWLESTLHYLNSIVFVEKNTYQKFCPSYL